MAWTQVSPSIYQRPLGEVEKPMVATISGERPRPREPVKIHCFAEFKCPRPAQQVTSTLRNAWKVLRLLKCPDIATTFKDGLKEYQVPSSEEVQKWAEQTFLVSENGASVQAVVREMQSRIDWMPVCYLVPKQQPRMLEVFEGTLILFISHWRTEASGAYQILNQLFDYASELMQDKLAADALSYHVHGSEVRLLTPPLEQIFPPRSDAATRARVEKAIAEHFSTYPPLEFPSHGNLAGSPSPVAMHRITFSTESTTLLIQACKPLCVTITSAVHAAYLGAVITISPDPSRAYACIMPAQLRKRLPASSPYRDQACWNAAKPMYLSAPSNQDFLTRAKYLRNQYTTADTEEWLYGDMEEERKIVVEHASKVPLTSAALPYFTACGRLDGDIIVPDHRPITVDDVYVFADPSDWPAVVLGTWTFRGMLNVEIHYNKAVYAAKDVDTMLDRLVETLKSELLDRKTVKIERRSVIEF
ncbi:hypothetical protein DV736_g3182, partial [Chaetothyriales sp. CBS 134916]